jgi:hypothetical protein
MTSSMQQTAPGLAEVLAAAARSPQLSLAEDWEVLRRRDAWWLRADAPLPQGQVVTLGGTAQSIALCVQAHGRRAHVDLLPDEDEQALAVVRLLGPGPDQRARDLLAADSTPPGPPRRLLPADLRHLALAAEAFGCELLWQRDAAAPRDLEHAARVPASDSALSLTSVVTPGDDVEDWLRAGQALVQCRLVALDLGFPVTLGPHALGHRETREEVRSLWQLDGWPQVELGLETHDEL